jgi:hypothetical protein
LGDIVIECSGGSQTAQGAPVPSVNVIVFFPSTVTSRSIPATPFLEPVLLVEEPSPASQFICASPPCYLSGAAPGQSPYAGVANVFRAQAEGADAIIFPGVPVDPPGSCGPRTFRITNLRLQIQAVRTGLLPAVVDAFVSVNGSQALPLGSNSVVVGYVQRSLDASASCLGSNSAQLQFSEHFPFAFRPQNDPADTPGSPSQGVPGMNYYAESGLFTPALYAAPYGQADHGTPLVANFSPWSGVSVDCAGSSSQPNGSATLSSPSCPPGATTAPLTSGTATWMVTGADPVRIDAFTFGVHGLSGATTVNLSLGSSPSDTSIPRFSDPGTTFTLAGGCQ